VDSDPGLVTALLASFESSWGLGLEGSKLATGTGEMALLA